MTALPTPKFTIGQIVWAASAENAQKPIPCPDCLGCRSWSVTTPAGETFEAPCPTCDIGWAGSSGTVNEWKWSPVVLALTLGSVRIDTESETPIQYMARETGVGSGRLWNEADLRADYGEAVTAAEACAIERKAWSDEEDRKRREQATKKKLRKPRKSS